MPCMRYAPATANDPGRRRFPPRAARDGRASSNVAPSRVCTRTSTSVMVACRPTNSMRLPPRPPGAVMILRARRPSRAARAAFGSTSVLDAFGKLQNDRQPHAGRHRRAPHDVVTIRQRLGQLEVGRARFVRARARVMRKEGQRGERQCTAQPSTAIAMRASSASTSRWRPMRRGRNLGRLRQMDLVVRLHRLECALPRSGPLLIDPSRLDVRFDLLVRGHAPGRRRRNEHQMPTQARLDGPLPGAGLKLVDRGGERASEYGCDLLRRTIGVEILEHEWIADRRDSR